MSIRTHASAVGRAVLCCAAWWLRPAALSVVPRCQRADCNARRAARGGDKAAVAEAALSAVASDPAALLCPAQLSDASLRLCGSPASEKASGVGRAAAEGMAQGEHNGGVNEPDNTRTGAASKALTVRPLSALFNRFPFAHAHTSPC